MIYGHGVPSDLRVVWRASTRTVHGRSSLFGTQVVSDVQWVSEKAVVVASGSSLSLCGPPSDGMHGEIM